MTDSQRHKTGTDENNKHATLTRAKKQEKVWKFKIEKSGVWVGDFGLLEPLRNSMKSKLTEVRTRTN